MSLLPRRLAQGARATRLLLGSGKRHGRILATARQIERLAWKHRRGLRGADPAALNGFHEATAGILADLCRQNGGAWIKFGQFLSCRPDLLSPAYIQAFQSLQQEALAVPFDDVQPWLETLLGDRWTRYFSEFNIIPVACASIAQVHHARLRDGREVAVKLQLPAVAGQLEQDATLIRLLARLIAPFIHEIDVKQVVERLLETTFRELDFQQEARNQVRFARLPHPAGIRVPAVHESISGPRLLVSDWMEGPSLARVLAEEEARGKRLLERLQESLLQQVLVFGFFHADPHPGNFVVMDNDDLAILDLGAVEEVSATERQHFTALLARLLGGGSEPLLPLFQAAGFAGLDEARLEKLSRALEEARKPDITLSEQLSRLLEEFRRLRLVIPDTFVSMARVIIILGGLMTRYHVPFRWPGDRG